jgi:hypothetical protein
LSEGKKSLTARCATESGRKFHAVGLTTDILGETKVCQLDVKALFIEQKDILEFYIPMYKS